MTTKTKTWTHTCYGRERMRMDSTWVYCPTCGTMADGTDRDGRLLDIRVRKVA